MPSKVANTVVFKPNKSIVNSLLSEDQIEFYHGNNKIIIVHPEPGMKFINFKEEISKCKKWNELK